LLAADSLFDAVAVAVDAVLAVLLSVLLIASLFRFTRMPPNTPRFSTCASVLRGASNALRRGGAALLAALLLLLAPVALVAAA
jgi:hypothetical protein